MAMTLKDLAGQLGRNSEILKNTPVNPVQLVLGEWVAERIRVAQAKLDEPKGTNPSRSSNATGSLRNSIAPETTTFGNKVVVDIMANDYWETLNYGVNGTQKKFGARYSFSTLATPERFVNGIRRWIRDRNIQPREPEMSRDELALVISKAVKRNGIEAVPFMTDAFNSQAIDELKERLEKEIKLNFI